MGAGAGCMDHRSEKSHLSQVKIVSKIQNFSMKQKHKYIYQEKVEEKKKAIIDSDLLCGIKPEKRGEKEEGMEFFLGVFNSNSKQAKARVIKAKSGN